MNKHKQIFWLSVLTPDLVYYIFNPAFVSALLCMGFFEGSFCLKPKDQEIPGTHCEGVEI